MPTAGHRSPTSVAGPFGELELGSPGRVFWAGAIVLFAALAVAGTWPVARHLGDRFPGRGGDSEMHAWTLWHLLEVAAGREREIYRTSRIFHPVGVSLHFHTLNLGGGLLALPLRGAGIDLAACYGLVWLATFFLSGLGAALLAWRTTGRRTAALAAGILFMFCPFRSAHALGHLEILGTQWLPFAVASSLVALAPRGGTTTRRRLAEATVAGIAFGLSSMSCWYYLVYLAMLGALAALCLVLARQRPPVAPVLVLAATAAAVTLPAALPMIRQASAGGAYHLATEREHSADLLGFLLPSSSSPLLRPVVAAATRGRMTFTSNPIEGDVGIGWTCLLLVAVGLTRSPRFFGLAAATFAVMALGPELCVAGARTGIPLPGALMPHVPFLKGARVPARFAIMVSLSLVPVAAAGIARLCARWPAKGRAIGAALVSLAFLELAPFGFPTSDASIPAAYGEMRDDPEPGAVIDLPHLFLRRNLYLHTVHGRPVAGGWVSRVQPEKRRAFRAAVEPCRDLVWAERPGAGAALPECLRALGVRFLVLDEVAVAQEPPRAETVRARLAEAFPEGPWRVEPPRRFYRIER